MTTQIITIDQTEFPVIVYKDLRVVTTELLAQAFGTETARVRKNHSRNKGRFIEGKHFFKIVGDELKEFASVLMTLANFSKVRSLILWTDRGAARHAKMLETDAAWDMFEKMEDCYFGTVQTQYGLKQLPEPLTITKAQQGVLFNKVVSIASGRGQIRSQIWSRFQNHFKLNSYMNLPADKFDEALDYLDAKNNEYNNGLEMLYVSNIELAALVDERVKAIEGELLPKTKPTQGNGITLNFEGDELQKLLVSVGPLGTTITRLLPDEMVIKKGQFYIMEKKDKVSAGKLVLDYIPHEFLPHMIEVAAARLDRTEAGKLKA